MTYVHASIYHKEDILISVKRDQAVILGVKIFFAIITRILLYEEKTMKTKHNIVPDGYFFLQVDSTE